VAAWLGWLACIGGFPAVLGLFGGCGSADINGFAMMSGLPIFISGLGGATILVISGVCPTVCGLTQFMRCVSNTGSKLPLNLTATSLDQ